MEGLEHTSTRAVCGAYLLVSFADGRFDTIEEARLLAGIAGAEELSFIEASDLEKEYNFLTEKFRADYRQTADMVLESIRYFANYAKVKEAVLFSARAAIVADQCLEAQEELALDLIAEALGVDKGSV